MHGTPGRAGGATTSNAALFDSENDAQPDVFTMTDETSTLPRSPRVFDGSDPERLVAVSLETVIHDVSPTGDRKTAMQLGGYVLGEERPPDDVPEFVELSDGHIELSNPPFLLAEIDVDEGAGRITLEVALESELHLLIDPPVEVRLSGPPDEVVEQLEQTIAEIYRTRGRHLEKIDAGIVDPGT